MDNNSNNCTHWISFRLQIGMQDICKRSSSKEFERNYEIDQRIKENQKRRKESHY